MLRNLKGLAGLNQKKHSFLHLDKQDWGNDWVCLKIGNPPKWMVYLWLLFKHAHNFVAVDPLKKLNFSFVQWKFQPVSSKKSKSKDPVPNSHKAMVIACATFEAWLKPLIVGNRGITIKKRGALFKKDEPLVSEVDFSAALGCPKAE